MREVSLKSPEGKRAGEEENFWRYHSIDFGAPLRVISKEEREEESSESSYLVAVRQRDYRQVRNTLNAISSDECRYSCGKDVAIYLNSPATKGFRNGRSFFDTVYLHFFPHRDMTWDISGNHFFGQVIDFKPLDGGGTLSEVIDFHQALCQKVEAEIPHLKQADPRFPDDFGLLPTFRSVFLMVEGDFKSEEPDVLVVCRDAELAQRLNFRVEEVEREPNAGSAGKRDPNTNGLSAAWPFRYRVGLIRFMDALFALDEKRRAGVQPDSLFWQTQITGEIIEGKDFRFVR